MFKLLHNGREKYTRYIPPEITDSIIDLLSDDQQSLIACSAVSRTWLPGSRHYLFRKIHIQGANVAQLVDILDSRYCSIRSHIRLVKVAWNRKVLEYHRFRRIVSLPAITMLHFYNIALRDISKETQSLLLGGLHGITALRITDTRLSPFEFWDLFHAFPSLEILQIEDFRWTSDLSRPIPVSQNVAHVRRLHMTGPDTARMLRFLMASADVWHLEALNIGSLGHGEILEVWDFIEMQKPHLQDLVVSVSADAEWTAPLDKLYLNDFTQLRSIELPLPGYRNASFITPVLPNLPPSIRTITFRLSITAVSSLESSDWSTFTALFLTPQFSTLESVRIWPQTRLRYDVDHLVLLLKEKLAECGASSIFTVLPITNWDLDLF